jgi:ribonuclease HI
MELNRIVASTDGSCLGAGRGAAGWAWFINDSNWQNGGVQCGTAQQAELLAALNLLTSTPADMSLHVISDSRYAIGVCTKWRAGWKRKGWRTANGGVVANLEIVQELDANLTGRTVTFEWVKGHSGNAMNEKADQLCCEASYRVKTTMDVSTFGPGCIL